MTINLPATLFLCLTMTAGLAPANPLAKRIEQLEAEVSELREMVRRMDWRSANNTSSVRGEYRVRSGDSLWGISRRTGINVNRLKAANPGLDPRRLRIGMKIKLPRQGNHSTKSVNRRTVTDETYIVRSGDTLSHIAKAHGLKIAQITSANPGLKPDLIRIGQKLVLPGKPAKPARFQKPRPTKAKQTAAPKPAKPTRPTPEPPLVETSRPPIDTPEVSPAKQAADPIPEALPRPMKLVVIQKNTRFFEIAKQHQSSVDELNRLNEVSLSSNQMVKAGSQLYVPKR